MVPFLLLVSLLPFLAGPASGDPPYLQATALPGDGVYALLRRYGLDRNFCNHEEFYRINGLRGSEGLQVGKSYLLPVLMYDYNGKSIRSTIGTDDWDLARKIEGYNADMLKEGYRRSTFTTDRVLWVPFHLLHCPEPSAWEQVPPSAIPQGEVNLSVEPAGNRRFPIFGKKYEHVPLKDQSLQGKVFFIESGHGGPDPGAMVTLPQGRTICEDEYAYDVALRLVRNLVAHGATAYMITRDPNDGIRDDHFLRCDSDEVVWGNEPIPLSHKPRLFQRSDVINELYQRHLRQGVSDQSLIVVHVDSRSRRDQTDLYFYYHPDDPAGRELATRMHRSMEFHYRKYRQGRGYAGTVSPRDLHMLRECQVPSAYIELGNIRHPTDQQRIILPQNRQLLADWLFHGLVDP